MKKFSLHILLVLSLLLGFGTISSVGVEASTPTNVEIQQWKGNNFTFLPLAAAQYEGYEIFTEDQADQGFLGDRSVRIPYNQYVGKQVTVNDVVPFADGDNKKDYVVHMTVNDTGEKLVGRSMRGQLAGLVLTDDLVNAREQFLGKTVYPKFRELPGEYVAGALPEAVPIKIGGPVTVVDVYAGNQSQEPISLVVTVNGQRAILPIAYTWTNSPIQPWTKAAPWESALFLHNPRTDLDASKEVWNNIEAGIVDKGMTKDQVSLSWGKPFTIEKDGTIWIYGAKKVIFDGDVVKSIEDITIFSRKY
jgi:hypothetical protein